jgi:putative hydrolase
VIDPTADWHTHSSLTDGADDPERMARAAADAGLVLWGLSDHVRAESTWVPEYVARVRRLDAADVAIRCGVEAKILDQQGHLDLPAGVRDLDYVLVADHQFPGVAGPMHPLEVREQIQGARLSPADAVEQLVNATVESARRSPFPVIVAHLFSLLPKCGLSELDVNDAMAIQLGTSLAAVGARVEVNEKWRCPSSRVLRLLAEAGVELTAGSDAHRHQDIGAHTYLDSLDLTSAVEAGHG